MTSPEHAPLFAEIILPLPLEGTFTYAVPEGLHKGIAPGMRAVVQFGPRRVYAGLVYALHPNKPEKFKAKPIVALLDDKAVVNARQLQLWEWMAGYYLSTLGEVMKAALPAGLKMESETWVVLEQLPEEEQAAQLDEEQLFILSLLGAPKKMKLGDLAREMGSKQTFRVLQELAAAGWVRIDERLNKRYKPKTESHVQLAENMRTASALEDAEKTLSRSPAQRKVMLFLHNMLEGQPKTDFSIAQRSLLKETSVSASALRALTDKGFIIIKDKIISRIDSGDEGGEPQTQPHLSQAQEKAWAAIRQQFEEHGTVLLHGVTGSGKTEIYIRLIEEQLAQGKQVLYLLPEIALTTQIIQRLRHHFGDKTGIYHSKFNDNERVEVWKRVAAPEGQGKKYPVVLGVRSSVFLPFDDLGLIIVDEEHENTYKQFDPAPRYHARDTAIMLARLHGAKTLLGTATPAFESIFNARQGKFGLVPLTTRFQDIAMPRILLSDLKTSRMQGKTRSLFTPLLIKHIEGALKNNEQVILFKNRRGFSQFLQCKGCGWVTHCKYCDVSLTYHKGTNQLSCHYCGYAENIPRTCPTCGSGAIEMKGFGTERIEDDLQLFFPEARVQRMDQDNTNTRRAHETILMDFQMQKTNILVGTQMVTKGLDFEHVSVVGILDADRLLHFPDFRAFERAYQLMTQVSGRAGRKHSQGTVIIQTYKKGHPVIQDVLYGRFGHLFSTQLAERKLFSYPPFYRLVRLRIHHREEKHAMRIARSMAGNLKQTIPSQVLGPQPPTIARIQSYYLQDILIKIKKNTQLPAIKQKIKQTVNHARQQKGNQAAKITIDVDPQ